MATLVHRTLQNFKRASLARKLALTLIVFLLVNFLLLLWGFARSALGGGGQVQALVVLGGSHYTEEFAVEVARENPEALVIISSGQSRPCAYRTFVTEGGLDWSRIITDFRATDTLTNFTATVPLLKERGIRRVVVVTTTEHWKRAQVHAHFVFGSAGISYRARLLQGGGNYETPTKRLVDSLRSLVWLIIGDTPLTTVYTPEEEAQLLWAKTEDECPPSSVVYRLPEFTSAAASSPEASNRRLFSAIARNDLDAVELALVAGADPQARDEEGIAAITRAIQANNADIVDSLLRRGADVRAVDASGKSPLQFVVPGSVVHERLRLAGKSSRAFAPNPQDIVTTDSADTELNIVRPFFVERYESGSIKKIVVTLENLKDKEIRGAAVQLRFKSGILSILRGTESIASGARAEFVQEFADSQLHMQLAEVRITCAQCEKKERVVTQFEPETPLRP